MNREKVNALLSALEKNVMAELVGPRRLTPHLIGPAVTFALTVAVEFLSAFPWYTPSLALTFIGLSVSAIYGGFWSSLISCAFILGYGVIEFQLDLSRLVQVGMAVISIAIVNTAGRRALKHWIEEAVTNRHARELIDAANGNLGKLREIHADTRNLINGWSVLDDKAKFSAVDQIRGNLATVLTVWEGWHALFKEREIMKWEHLSRKLKGGNH